MITSLESLRAEAILAEERYSETYKTLEKAKFEHERAQEELNWKLRSLAATELAWEEHRKSFFDEAPPLKEAESA